MFNAFKKLFPNPKETQQPSFSIDRIDYHHNKASQKCQIELEVLELDHEVLNRYSGKHIGIFVTWLAKNDYLTHEFPQEIASLIVKIKTEELTGLDFLIEYLDGKLYSDNVIKNLHPFIEHLYADFWQAYVELFIDELYITDFSWEDYHDIAPDLDRLLLHYQD